MKNLLYLSLALFLFSACSEKKPEQFTEDKTLFEHANKLFEKGDFTQAIPFFESLKNRFPQSPFAAESELKIADSHFEKDELLEAEVLYRNFRTLHPANEKVPYALFRMGLSQYKRKPGSVDRDQSDGQKAIETFSELVRLYPNAKEIPEAKKYIEKCQRALLEREMYVSNFYLKHDQYNAAILRLKGVANSDQFQDLKWEAKFKMAQAYLELKDKEEAKTVLTEVAQSTGEYQSRAKELLRQVQ